MWLTGLPAQTNDDIHGLRLWLFCYWINLFSSFKYKFKTDEYFAGKRDQQYVSHFILKVVFDLTFVVCVRVYVHTCVRACERACMCVCVVL